MSDKKLPQGWAKVQLNDLVRNPKSDLVDGPFGSNLKSSEYVESGIPVLKIQNIKANRFVEKRLSYVTPEKAAELSRHSFMAGDLMITKLGEPLGLCCEVPPHLEHGIFVADLMRLRPAPEIISSKFLLHAVNSVVVQNQFKEITKGTTRQRVNLSIVRDINIELPPLNEQHRIVTKIEELFSELDNGIEALKTAREQLKVYRQALLKHAFEGKLTAAWRAANPDKLEPAATLFARIQTEREQRHQQQLQQWQANGSSLVQRAGKPKAPKPLPPLTAEELAELPELPEGWGWVKVGDVGILGTGVTPLKGRSDFYENGSIPWVTSGALNENFVSEASDYVTQTALDETNLRLYPKHTLLVALYGEGKTRGKCSELLIEATTNQAIAAIVLEGLAAEIRQYIKWFFQKNYGDIRLKSSGGVQPNLNLGIIENTVFPMCSLTEAKCLVEMLESKLSEADQLDQTLTTSLQQSEALRQSILKRAFAGTLVAQDPHDEPVAVLLERIRAERATGGKSPAVRRSREKSLT